jgi:hypothetical protein
MRDMVDPYEILETKNKNKNKHVVYYIAYIAESGEGEMNEIRKEGQMRARS